jgi:hypothetical protein
MPNSSKSANRVTRLHNIPSRALRGGLRDGRDFVHEGLTRAPRLDGADARLSASAMTQPDRPNTPPWSSSILAFFMEGFALYGASYCASPHAIVTSPVESSSAQATAPQSEEISWRQRRRAMAIVSFSTRSEVTEFEDHTDRAGSGSEIGSGRALLYTDRSNRRNWLTERWHAIASRWAQRRREREIKKAIAALMEPGRGSSRNIGIANRSRIEQIARYRRDC